MSLPQAHIPVMLREVIEALKPHDGGLYVDGTFGRGGYTRAILESAQTNVIGIDRDPDAIREGQKVSDAFAPRLRLMQGTFGNMATLLSQAGINAVDGIALDLGVSSPQIDTVERGFSFAHDGPLDMRMSQEGPSAADLVNQASEKDLADIIYQYGEERHSRRVARAIVEARKEKPITRTSELAAIVRAVVPPSKDGIDPATRTFQALRIAVNDELGELKRGLKAAEILLKPEGRLAIVSFHSLEDRIVKDYLRAHSDKAPNTSRHIPETGLKAQPAFRLITHKPQLPTEAEIDVNPRARSARMRVAERTFAASSMETAE